ncbi:hypothetical protein EST38_g13795 [Candolleomyces aberdarensis]|uniref:CCHC-type domain-containing protein n=1 Tax=Candolleomyces aberdarensis TaxID=2316362 RepID=A0A4Q2CYX2_9AGAR|nr:hypothetical protein EST38_g13795 [Candolleomyces aberdarensis]
MEGISIGKTTTEDRNGKDLGNKPPTFGGERSELNNFLHRLAISLALNPTNYATHAQKIFFTISYLTDEAGLWADAWMKSIPESEEGQEKDWGTFKDFIAELQETFQPTNEENNAMIRLDKLRQEDRHASEILTKFKLEARKAGLLRSGAMDDGNAKQLIQKLKKTLKPGLVEKLIMLNPQPTTFEDWCKKAITLDDIWYEARETMKGLRPPPKNPVTKSRSVSTAVTTIGKLTKEERDRCIKENLCFRCRSPKHMAKDCDGPGRPPKEAPRATSNPRQQPKKPTPRYDAKQTYSHIRSIIYNMDPEFYEEFSQLMDENQPLPEEVASRSTPF